jgi:hypothetical protein
MRALTFACLWVLAVACAGTNASACVYLPIISLGDKPSAAELIARRKEESERQVRYGIREARRGWPGEAGAADALAELLVPNVRPVRIENSDCGPMNEVDLGKGQESPDDLLAGTRYAGRADEFTAFFRGYQGGSPGFLCNAEVRVRYAAHLRRRLTPQALRESYVFMRARRPETDLVVRMTAFENRSRRPPLLWMGRDERTTEQVRRWLRRQPAGIALKAATEEFWRENEPLLADTKLACPAAAEAWTAAQAALVRAIDEVVAEQRAAR